MVKNFSPTTIQAMRRKGIDPQELYFVSFRDFVNINPSLMSMNNNLQEVRYQHFESKRNDKISVVKEERRNLIDNPGLALESKIGSGSVLKTSQVQDSVISNRNKDESTALKLEQEKLEKIKKKQVIDLI